MAVFSFLKSVYNLDTLDTRFTTESSVPYKTIVESRNDPEATRERIAKYSARAQPSKFKTPEFFLYYGLLSFIIPYMFYLAYDVSKPSNPEWHKFEQHLFPGWIPGRHIDLSDAQYRTFRTNLPAMTALLVFHPLLRRLYNSFAHPIASGGPSSRPTLEEAEERLDQRASFDFGFAVFFLLALHGISAFKVLLILYINYKLATTLPRRFIPLATWVFNIGILFANDLCTGYKLGDMAWYLSGRPDASLLSDPPTLVSWGHWLDSFGGIMSRWQILFNITVLRLISFNMDYYWSLDRRSHSPVEVSRRSQATSPDDTDSPKKKQLDPSALSENDRVSTPALARDFNFRNYVAYAIYAPLYLTGPIITFNDFISQLRYRPATIETPRTVRYGIRFLLTLLAMEVILHFDYIQAISNSGPDWSQYTSTQLSTLSYFNLCMIWLKLLLPWRLFRLWSLVDGIDPPENMLRCVSNNYSAFSFWRSWHRSYNRWLTRYIYIPLGGSSFRDVKSTVQSLANYILTFTFVALWHDIQLKLLIWGWLIVLFMLPEAAARVLFPAHKWTHMPTTYRMVNCAGAVCNILMMMMANLVGFAVGLEGLQGIIDGILKDFWGFTFLLIACSALFFAVQIMFEWRESELRRGIWLKC